MTKNSKVTPTELTSGKGFDFEDLVGAWLTTYMLSSSHFIPHKSSLIKAIYFQAGNSGWIFDDILVEFSDSKKDFKLALSVKSNKQFTSKKAPDDLVEDIWKQFLNESTPFDSNCDYLGIVTAPLSGISKTSLTSLLTKSEYLPEGELQEQVDNTKLAKNVCSLHKSFNCSSTLLDAANRLNLNTDKILKRFKAYQCDFYDQPSTSEIQSITNIKSILVDPSASNATDVFEKICTLVKRYRVNGGAITSQIAASFIAKDIQLKTAPEFAMDLKKLKAYSTSAMNRIDSSIGSQVSLLRVEEISKVRKSISSANVSIVLGESGSGKSALVKRLALSHTNRIWVEPSLFEYNSLHEAENGAFQLKNPWVDIAAEITSKYKILVIDAVDRLWKSSYFSTLGEFLEPILSENTGLKIVITCQSFHWQRVQNELLKIGSAIATENTVSLGDISQDDIATLRTLYPQFNKLLATESVRKFLLRPKVLDLFSKLPPSSFSKSNPWHSEVELINWYWDSVISNSTHGAMKERFLIKLSKLQAENLVNTTQTTMFEVPELSVLEELEQSQICYRKKGYIYLTHDIYSDWFKQRTLVNERVSNPSFLDSCIKNPQWHRAISLFGSELVQDELATAEWENVIKSALKSKNFLLVDLLLDAIIHTSNSCELILKHWVFLTTNKAALLDRFFKRFLYIATQANKKTIALAKYFNVSELDASLINRTPIWLMWPSVLTLIIEKQEDLIEIVPKNTAEICKLWVNNTQKDVPYRKDLSEIAIKIGWRALQCNQHYRYHDRWAGHNHDDISFYYETVLSCAAEDTAKVIQFANCASGITEPTTELPPDPPREPTTDPQALEYFAKMEQSSTFLDEDKQELPLIEGGAIYKRDHYFQKLVIETKFFINLMLLSPKESADIILANCIREPGAKYRYSSSDIDKDYGLTKNLMRLFPPFYTKTPFLELLTISPEQGMRVILRLTEIATSQWLSKERFRREHSRQNMFDEGYPLSINLSIKGVIKEYYGDRRWMHACRNTTIVPDLLTCALMSLEKWLSDKLDNGEDVNQEIEELLTKSDSLAIVGVCFQVAKKESALFKGVLFELLMNPWIFVYDLHHCISDEHHQMIGHRSMGETEHQFNEAKEWHLREYRKTHLETIIFRQILSDQNFERKIRNELLPTLQNLLNKTSKEDEYYTFILKLRHQLELKNWTTFKNKDGNIQFKFNTPGELLELQRKDEIYFETKQIILHLPNKCLEILNSNIKLNEQEFKKIFDNLSNIEPNILKQEDEYLSLVRSQCAVATTIILKRDQLPNLYREHREYCKNILLHYSLNPPQQEFEIAESNFEIEWDRFCAKALPKLLAENSTEKELRTAIVKLCLGLHYETLGVLVSQCFLLRDQIQEDFYRLLNLVNFWAALRLRIMIATKDNIWGNEPLTAEQLYTKVDQLADKFINKSLSISLPVWSNLQVLYSQYNNEIEVNTFPEIYRKMDCHVVMYGYSWLPPLDEAITDKEKDEWYSIYQQLSLVLWERLIFELDEKDEIDGTPYEIDYWIIDKIIGTLLHCPKDIARKLWEPLLSVGAAAEYWITDFMRKWFNQLSKVDVNKMLFLDIWRDMIVFAKNSEAWFSEVAHWHTCGKVWEALLGFDLITAQSVWKQDYTDLIISMRHELSYYAENHLTNYKIEHFASFLNTTSGKALSLDGVVWIYQHMTKYKSSRIEKYTQDSVNDLIRSVLDANRFDQLSKDSKGAILGLLKLLADCQNTKSMELYKKLTFQ
ncbi:hypothetical protein [Marinomonas lutimaris]|uniref:hypothetical protein n=1 Tax=Marinomonas lutimaris TaxID=2846746 RepID=UPI001CA5A7DF|nr:hypothetical protein [Marinomonas lutimaris]